MPPPPAADDDVRDGMFSEAAVRLVTERRREPRRGGEGSPMAPSKVAKNKESHYRRRLYIDQNGFTVMIQDIRFYTLRV
jgi:hypothetical protein